MLFEIYVAMNIFFIMDLTQNKTALFTTVIYVVGALFLTFINFLFYPVLVRYACMTNFFSLSHTQGLVLYHWASD